MRKNICRIIALILTAALAISLFAGCNDSGAESKVRMPSGLDAKEKFLWGMSRLPGKLSEQLLAASGTDFLGVMGDAADIETTIEAEGYGPDGYFDSEIIISNSYNKAGVDAGLTVDYDDGSFGVYMVDDYLYICPPGDGSEAFRLYLEEEPDLAKLFSELYESMVGGELALMGTSADKMLDDIVSIVTQAITDSCFSEKTGSLKLPSGKTDTERVVLTVGGDELVGMVMGFYAWAMELMPESPDYTQAPVPGAADPERGYYESVYSEYFMFIDSGYNIYYYDSYNERWVMFGGSFENPEMLGYYLLDMTYIGADSDAGALARLGEAGIVPFDPYYDGYDDTDYKAGYYYDSEDLYWYYYESGYGWFYYNDYYECWISEASRTNFRKAEFISGEHGGKIDAPAFTSPYGRYSEPGYYYDEWFEDWYYLAVGEPGFDDGWYCYYDEYYGWEWFGFTYYWDDLTPYGAEYDENWGVPSFGTEAQTLYTEPGYYTDEVGCFYYLSIDPETEGWYWNYGYGWEYYGEGYYWGDLTYLGEEYSLQFGVAPFAPGNNSYYVEPGYYSDDWGCYYYRDEDGQWYYFDTWSASELEMHPGWQYYSDSYEYDDLSYLGDSTGEVPEFEGVGSGGEEYFEKQLTELFEGFELSVTVDFYEGDLAAVILEFALPQADVNIRLELGMYSSGFENMLRLDLSAEAEGDGVSLYFENSMTENGKNSYKGKTEFSADAGGDNITLDMETLVSISKSAVTVDMSFELDSNSDVYGDGTFSWTQNAPDKEGVARDSGEGEAYFESGSDEVEAEFRVSRRIKTNNVIVEPEKWNSRGRTFESVVELIKYFGDYGYSIF